jgi:probable HAF family extracellular repeat protein
VSGPEPYKIRTGDVNHDGRPDIVAVGWGSNTVEVYGKQFEGTIAAPISYQVIHGGWEHLALGDVNNDGLLDVVIIGQSYQPTVAIAYQTPDGKLSSPMYPNPKNNVIGGVAVGDVTGDQLNDIVVSSATNKPDARISIFPQDSAADFGNLVNYNSENNPGVIAIADINNDGSSSILVAHDGWNSLGVFGQGSDGALDAEQCYFNPSYRTDDIAVGDINNDGLPDVVMAGEQAAGEQGGLVVLRHTSPPHGDEWWLSLGSLGGSWSIAQDISANGKVVVGKSSFEHWDNFSHPFLWTWENGIIDLGTLGDYFPDSSAYGVSADGSVVVGTSSNKAFRWTQADGMKDIGSFGGEESKAYGVSADGNIVVGYSTNSGASRHAFRWSQASGMQNLGALGGGGWDSRSWANGVSADGSTVVGWSSITPNSSLLMAFKWTQDTGMIALGSLGGPWSEAKAVSANGAVIVGGAYTFAQFQHAFRWSESKQMVDLGTLPGGMESVALGVSDDGHVIVGMADDESGVAHAFRWTQESGMQTIEEWITDNNGANKITDVNFLGASAVSNDGKIVVGQLGNGQAFLSRVEPQPVDVSGNATGFVEKINTSWNLLSLPLTPADPSVQSVLGPIKDHLLSAWRWENGAWSVYLPSLNKTAFAAYINSKGFTALTNINAKEGFWVNSDTDQSLNVTGTQPADTSLSIAKGWNLLGPKGDAPQAVADLVSGYESQIASVWKWESGTWSVNLPGENDNGKGYSDNKGFGHLTTINPGEGFWVNSTTNIALP